MLKLIESGDKNTFFERFKANNNYFYEFDFPAGLIVYFNNNTWEIFGDTPRGSYTAGCDCCSRDYITTDFDNLIYWELYEVTPPTAAQPPKLLL